MNPFPGLPDQIYSVKRVHIFLYGSDLAVAHFYNAIRHLCDLDVMGDHHNGSALGLDDILDCLEHLDACGIVKRRTSILVV